MTRHRTRALLAKLFAKLGRARSTGSHVEYVRMYDGLKAKGDA